MSLRTSATRYAKALFDVGIQEQADLAKLGADLSAMAQVLAGHTELRLATERAGVTDASRIAVMDAISDQLGVAPQVKKLIALLTRTRKLALVPDLSETYNERLLAHQNIVRADVTSAAPLSSEKTRALQDSLSTVTGKKVELTLNVDPDLLGGVVARIGSTVYDGSVKTQLAHMRQELVKQ
jgi:F-type H+-transporting ATPase subunit delta